MQQGDSWLESMLPSLSLTSGRSAMFKVPMHLSARPSTHHVHREWGLNDPGTQHLLFKLCSIPNS